MGATPGGVDTGECAMVMREANVSWPQWSLTSRIYTTGLLGNYPLRRVFLCLG